MNYLNVLDEAYDEYNAGADSVTPKIIFLGSEVFKFNTFNDQDLLEEMAFYAVNVINAVNINAVEAFTRTSRENYRWFNLIRNMTIFAGRIIGGFRGEWGWDDENIYEIEATCIPFEGKEERGEFDYKRFTFDEWSEFMTAIVEFIGDDLLQLRKRYSFTW